ncbi:hypothetical protein Dsin_020585 [Dipteronia sinensis]|uniref:non-specific serine/threonine protein kinase n=1 Tax=Dipteronia sinensis TaxID=43782 RepID=A0AAE0AAA7_9ROSI|nr:hypothetical protein Dsin_020585 [Dipteronia sinensis]
MKTALSSSLIITIIVVISGLHTLVDTLGSASTTAISYGGVTTVCGIIAGEATQRVQCFQGGKTIQVLPNVSFQAISGGRNVVCGLRSGGLSLFCWETRALLVKNSSISLEPKRLYYNRTVQLADVTVGDDHVCAREVNSGVARCWRGVSSPGVDLKFSKITSGSGFSCGILRNNSRVFCWGDNGGIGDEIQRQFGDLSMSNLVAGDSHACGLSRTGFLVCKGNNDSGQLNVPFGSAFEFSGFALGVNFSCAIRQKNGLVTCWGGNRLEFDIESLLQLVSFESIVAGLDFVCGLTTRNLSVICWGPGWSQSQNSSLLLLPIGMIIPGPCIQSSCSVCGMYLNSEFLCDGSGNICKLCHNELPIAAPLPRPEPPPRSPDPPTKARENKISLAFLIVGSVGGFAGICAIVYCLLVSGLCGFLRHRIYNSAQPVIADANVEFSDENGPSLPTLRSFSIRRHSSLGRQRSSSSSVHIDKAENFSLSELAAATNNFSVENKIGSGSFGSVFKGKLPDGRRVAIKRGEIMISTKKTKKFLENDSAFGSELALLSRLHHKHLVGLVGFCQEIDERLLVYEYMSNGALHDHLHNNKTEKNHSILNSWKMRIKIALDAARGIEYLHNYAVPPIIHRDIKSSNILLDANWTARVSDFGLSLMGPESDLESMTTKAVGTVGYIDPEYYTLNVLTAKSDVYGFGVVLLELLTGKKAVFKNEEDGTGPMGVVEYAVPLIVAGQLHKVLDKRVRLPEINEAEAVDLLATTALHCVNLEGRERPNLIDIVANLEKASALCEDSSLNFFSTTTYYSTPSD